MIDYLRAYIRPQPREVWITDLVVGLALMLTVGFPFVLSSDWSFYFDWAVAATWPFFTAGMLLRRISPEIAFTIVSIGFLVKLVTGAPPHGNDIGLLMVYYTCAAQAYRRGFVTSALASVTYPIIYALHLAMFPRSDLILIGNFTGRGIGDFGEFVQSLLYLGLPITAVAGMFWLAGLVQRVQVFSRETAHAAQLVELEYERSREKLVVEQERHQIARDMHDVVAHSLAVVVAQADGARYLAKTDPAKSAQVLGTIADTARSALVEVRALLAQLRHTQPSGPQQSMADLDSLFERLRTAGLQVTISETGQRGSLGAATQLAVYRLIQEALTNSLKYGDGRKPTTVQLDWGSALDITVRNDLTTRAPRLSGAGHGLIGMRERILVIGGLVSAGTERNQFVVRARVPFQGASLVTDNRDLTSRFAAPTISASLERQAPPKHTTNNR